LRWRKQYMLAQNATYRDGLLFVRYWDQATSAALLDAVDPATGAVRWTSGLTTYNLIAAGSGVVMTDLWALDERTGALRWTADPGPTATNWGRPFIADGRAYQNNATTVAAFDPTTGHRLWLTTKSGTSTDPGSGNAVPALHGGLLYVRASPGPKAPVLVLDAATGAKVRTLPRSDGAMAFDGTTAFLTQRTYGQNDVLRAVNVTTGATYWSRTVPHPRNRVAYVGPTPIVSNGLIWIATVIDTITPGALYALDERTGKVVTKTALPCPTVYDAEGPSLGDNVNMALAQHHLFVPTACKLLAFVAR
jgi:outer membrane protein assembly factor BamB